MKRGTGSLTMGHMAIGKPKAPTGSVLDGAPREGFTAYAAKFFNAVIPADDVSELDAKVLQARMAFAAKVGRN